LFLQCLTLDVIIDACLLCIQNCPVQLEDSLDTCFNVQHSRFVTLTSLDPILCIRVAL
jgi:hypothetical protein